MSTWKVYGPFVFHEDTVMGTSYLEMLQTWLFPKLNEWTRGLHLAAGWSTPLHFLQDLLLVERHSSTQMDRTGWSWWLDFLSVACMVPWPNPLWLLPFGVHDGQSVCSTATWEHTWFAEQDYYDCGDHHTRTDQNVARIRLLLGCALWPRLHTSNTWRVCVIK